VPAGADAFAKRGAIPPDGGFAYATNKTATKETNEPNHAGRLPTGTVWWSWTPTTAGSVILQTAGSTFDTVLAVYRGTAINALSVVTSNNDVSLADKTSRVTFSASAGTTYLIVVDGYDTKARGNITLIVTPPPSFARPNIYGVPAWLKLDAANKITTAEKTFSTLTGSVNPLTGVFIGSFNVRALVTGSGSQLLINKPVPLEGVFQQGAAAGHLGTGFFLLPPFTTVETTRSGLGVFNLTPPRAKYP